MKNLVPVLLLLFAYTQSIQAQSDEEGRFTATIIAGACFSQIDGDEDGGFSKVGFNGGVRGGIRFGKAWELAVEILFAQKGSYVDFINKTYHLDYAEVPVLFYYKDWKAKDRNSNREYRRIMAGAGFAYGRLINANIRQYGNPVEVGHPGYADFLPNDFSIVLDANVFITRQWGVGIRWTRSLATILRQPIRQGATFAINRTIVARVVFRL